MRKTVYVALGTLLVIAPATASAADSMKGMTMSQKLAVSAVFDPAPPKQGMESITITVKDAMGKPVKGAAVKVATNMPTMSMTGPTVAAQDNGNGTYVAKTNLNFATTWTFDVTASSGSQKGTTHLSADVK
jgi:nitrogen fixation protein FixH